MRLLTFFKIIKVIHMWHGSECLNPALGGQRSALSTWYILQRVVYSWPLTYHLGEYRAESTLNWGAGAVMAFVSYSTVCLHMCVCRERGVFLKKGSY